MMIGDTIESRTREAFGQLMLAATELRKTHDMPQTPPHLKRACAIAVTQIETAQLWVEKIAQSAAAEAGRTA